MKKTAAELRSKCAEAIDVAWTRGLRQSEIELVVKNELRKRLDYFNRIEAAVDQVMADADVIEECLSGRR